MAYIFSGEDMQAQLLARTVGRLEKGRAADLRPYYKESRQTFSLQALPTFFIVRITNLGATQVHGWLYLQTEAATPCTLNIFFREAGKTESLLQERKFVLQGGSTGITVPFCFPLGKPSLNLQIATAANGQVLVQYGKSQLFIDGRGLRAE